MAFPVIVAGVAGIVFIVTALDCALDVPHVFVAVTLTFPDVDPNVNVAEFVP